MEQTNEEYELSLKQALKNKNNLIEKARIYTENKMYLLKKLKNNNYFKIKVILNPFKIL
jgi:hypothetical protein